MTLRLAIALLFLTLSWAPDADARPRHPRGPRGPGFRRPPPPGAWTPPTCTGGAGSCGFLQDLDAVVQTEDSAVVETTAPESTTTQSTNATREKTSNPGDVPYFYQYDNALSPSASCQNTSVAMLLKHYGVNVTPDRITSRFGKDKAQSPEGLASVFNTLAAEAGISQRLRAHRDGNMADINAQLQAGTPTIVHGYFTGYGHVVLATGYDGSSYTVNDPAGRWSGSFKGGYGGGQSSTSGDGVRYSASSFSSAVATSNGSSFLAPWWHEVYTVR
jgi:uncharacterized protein YvpB